MPLSLPLRFMININFFKFVGKTWLLEKIKFVVPLEESSRALCVLQRTSLTIKYVIEV